MPYSLFHSSLQSGFFNLHFSIYYSDKWLTPLPFHSHIVKFSIHIYLFIWVCMLCDKRRNLLQNVVVWDEECGKIKRSEILGPFFMIYTSELASKKESFIWNWCQIKISFLFLFFFSFLATFFTHRHRRRATFFAYVAAAATTTTSAVIQCCSLLWEYKESVLFLHMSKANTHHITWLCVPFFIPFGHIRKIVSIVRHT